jgi:hypothetical protein
MSETDETNGEALDVLRFVAGDDDGFDVDAFVEAWPKTVKEQRLATAMLVVRNARESDRTRRSLRVLAGAVMVLAPAVLLNLGDTFAFTGAEQLAMGAVGAVMSGAILFAIWGKR